MRRLLFAAFIGVVAQGAHAADLPILRGSFQEPPPVYRTVWDGFYVGAHYGYSSHDFDFSRTTLPQQEFLIRQSIYADSVDQWQLLGTSNQRTSGFGGFAGYNFQFEDAIVGVEASYTHFSGKWGSSGSALTRNVGNPDGPTPPPGHTYEYTATMRADARARVNDLLTLRARGGYSIGSFMPYGFAGLAAAFVDIDGAASVILNQYDRFNETVIVGGVSTTVSHRDFVGSTVESKTESQKNLLTWGFTAGLGFEYLMWSNIFVRAEYEYTQLTTAKDTIIQLNTGRVGVGAKF